MVPAVWSTLAYDTFRNVWVAIKQIHPHLLLDPGQAAKYRRLLREAVLAGKIVHPHIVALIDVDERADPPYLVLEYVKGRSLETYTSPHMLLPVPEVLDIAFKCCNALEYAHFPWPGAPGHQTGQFAAARRWRDQAHRLWHRVVAKG